MARRVESDLREIVPAAQNNINAKFIVLEKGRVEFEGMGGGQNSRRCTALVADETAAVDFELWGEECEAFETGDILRLSNGIFSYNRSRNLVLRAGKRGKVEKVGEFTMNFVETPHMSRIAWIRDPATNKYYVQQQQVVPVVSNKV